MKHIALNLGTEIKDFSLIMLMWSLPLDLFLSQNGLANLSHSLSLSLSLLSSVFMFVMY